MVYEEKIETGLALLSQGLVKEADKIFCDILQTVPDFPEALYGRACVAHKAGKPALAVGFAGRAIEIAPQSYYYIILGMALYEEGHFTEAQTALQTAITLDAKDPRAYHELALIQEACQDISSAELSFRKAIELAPASLILWQDLIRFYWQGKAFDQVLNIARDAVTNNPEKIEFLHELGVILFQLHQLEEAEHVFTKMIRLNPKVSSAYANLGAVLFQLNKLKEANIYLTQAMKLAPDTVETQVNLGLVKMGLGELNDAKILLENAYQYSSQDPKIGLNLSTIYYELRDLNRAEQLNLRLLNQAQSVFITENDRDKITYNQSTLLLAKGKLLQGWQQMEIRHNLLNHFQKNSDIPVWNGKDKVGCLLVRTEQGLGDTIQFLRFLPALLKKCPLVIEAPRNLLGLLQTVMKPYNQDFQWRIVERGTMLPHDVTHQTMLMSLPYLLQITIIPAYQIDIRDFNEEFIVKKTDYFNVGICWYGSKEYRFDQLRSLSVSELFVLFTIPKVNFYALQSDLNYKDLPKGFTGWLPDGDLYETACFIQSLDLVITVDTVIAHLAGMLGKSVWLLNRFGGDWRWYPAYQDGRNHSLWYPTLKIFQQTHPLAPDQAWKEVILKVKMELMNILTQCN